MGAAALLGLGASAAGIESANVVGYTTTNCVADTWYLCGVQFNSTTNTSLSIQDAIKGTFTAQADSSTAPMVQYWNGTKLVTYYYLTDAIDGESIVNNAWADVDMNVAKVTIPAITGFWIKSTTAATVSFTK